jgi:hypothetical protein
MKHPTRLYFVLGNLGRFGLAGADPVLDLGDAADRWAEWSAEGYEARVLMAEFDAASMDPTQFVDVTDQCADRVFGRSEVAA